MPFDPRVLGHLIEGIVEQDPMTDEYVIRTIDAEGRPQTFSIQEALSSLKGKQVRFTLASIENLAKLAQAMESQGGGGRVHGLVPDGISGFNVARQPDDS